MTTKCVDSDICPCSGNWCVSRLTIDVQRSKPGSKTAKNAVMYKLDEEQVRWVIRQKNKGIMNNIEIAESVGASSRLVRKLWSKYKPTSPDDITYPLHMGRLSKGLAGRREHSAMMSCCINDRRMAVRLETVMEMEQLTQVKQCKS